MPIELDTNSSRPASVERVGQRREHALGDDGRLARVGHVLEQHGELVAAHARHGVARAQRRVQAPGDGLQQLIADLVAERVVDDLEAVEVEEQHGGARRRRRAGARAAATARAGRGTACGSGSPVSASCSAPCSQALDRAPVVGGVAQRHAPACRRPARPSAGGRRRPRARAAPTAAAPLGSPSRITCARGSSSSSAGTRGGVGQRRRRSAPRRAGAPPTAASAEPTLVTQCTSAQPSRSSAPMRRRSSSPAATSRSTKADRPWNEIDIRRA